MNRTAILAYVNVYTTPLNVTTLAAGATVAFPVR